MAENLVIVESPTKAKTIEKFLGKEYLVKSSFGHVRDLPKKGLGVDVKHDFTPTYEVAEDKKKIVEELKKLAGKAKRVWLASDEDREGEAIAWHLSQVLNLDVNTTHRIVFHEITKNAITKAVANPRIVNINLVNAQQARRILDRLVGFELSPVLWRKVKPSLSAGRVQSVAVRLIVQREREIINFKGGDFYRTTAIFTVKNQEGNNFRFKAELNHRFKSLEETKTFLNTCIGAQYHVASIEKKPAHRSPSAPFTTSTLQQEAGRKLGFSVSQTMSIAQRLYEAGLITYMRTDSVNLSDDAMSAIKSVITDLFGSKSYHKRIYKTKSKGAQEAHEAIRPSYIERQHIEGSPQEKKLYHLIWNRTVASQMSDALLERTVIDIAVSSCDKKFIAKGEVIVDEGFLKLYGESSTALDEETDKGDNNLLLPPVTVGTELYNERIETTQRFDQRPPRFSEATLVKHLEELGIGRPSTYAPTISTIINRGYVVKEDRDGVERKYLQLTLQNGQITEKELTEITGTEKAKLFSTNIGILVNDYLESHFPAILDYNFTAKVEEEFDDIAKGELAWDEMIRRFYQPFHQSVTTAEKEEGSFASSQQRSLGTDPVSGKQVYARIGRFGPMVQIGESGDENNKPKYASLRAGQLIETITLDEALKLFALPRLLGEYEGKTVTIGVGRFGPYIRHDGKFVSLPQTENPYTIQLDKAIELIEEKRKKDREKVLKLFPEDEKLQLLNGRWGAYISYDGVNYKLPKNSDINLLSYDEIMKLVEQQKAEGETSVKKRTNKRMVKTKK